MRRLAKFIVAIILCFVMLSTSTAWARDKYYRSAHPKGDDSGPRADGGNGNIVVVVMTSTPFGPKLPTIVIVTTQEAKTTSSYAIRKPIVKRRAAQSRKGNLR